MKKKIGYVIPTFPVLSETFVGVEMRAMMAQGHAVQPFAFSATSTYQPEDEALVHACCYIPTTLSASACRYLTRWGAAHPFMAAQQGFTYLSLLKQGVILADLARKHECTHLHAHFAWHSSAVAIVAARLAGISVSFVGHGADIYRGPQDLNAKLQHTDFAVAVTQQMQSELTELTPKPIHYVACGLESEKFPPLATEWQPEKHFLFVGRLVAKKDIGSLLTAVSQLPANTTLDIVGDGPLGEEIEQRISDLHLNQQVRCLGAQPKSWFIENAQHYHALVAPFCIAKDGDRDTGPLVVKEAMALGLPVITSTLPGCNEILDTQSGIRVPMGDSAALAKAMASLLNVQHSALLQMRQSAHQRVHQHYSSHLHAATLSHCIETTGRNAVELHDEGKPSYELK